MGITLFFGSLALLAIAAQSTRFHVTSSAESTNLVALSPVSRLPSGFTKPMGTPVLPGSSPLTKIAMPAREAFLQRDVKVRHGGDWGYAYRGSGQRSSEVSRQDWHRGPEPMGTGSGNGRHCQNHSWHVWCNHLHHPDCNRSHGRVYRVGGLQWCHRGNENLPLQPDMGILDPE